MEGPEESAEIQAGDQITAYLACRFEESSEVGTAVSAGESAEERTCCLVVDRLKLGDCTSASAVLAVEFGLALAPVCPAARKAETVSRSARRMGGCE